MFSLQNNLRAKLAASMVLSIVIVLLSGLFAIYQTEKVLKNVDAEGELYDANERAVMELQVQFKEQVRQWKDILLRGRQPELLDRHWNNFLRLEKNIQEDSARLLTKLQHSDARPHLEQFLSSHTEMGERYRRALAVFKNSRFDSRLADADVTGIDRAATEDLRKAVKHISAEAEEFSSQVRVDAWTIAIANFSLMLIALSGGVAFFFFSLKKNVFTPLSGLAAFAHKVAQGQYGLRLPVNSKDEIGAVTEAFNHASEEIERLVNDLKASEAQHRDLVEGIDAIVWELDSATQTFVFVSPSAEAILGYPAANWLHNDTFWALHFHPEDTQDAAQKIAQTLKDGASEFEHRTVKADGDIVWLHSRVRAVGDGSAPRLLGITMNVNKLKQLEAQTEYFATHEKLTGLPNRHLLMDRLEQAMAYAQRSDKAVGLLLVNLDRFKMINDSLGQEVGDEVIKQIAYRLLGYVHLDDTVAHLGRDEFAIVLREISQAEHLADVAGKILAAISAPLDVKEHTVTLTCSLGLSLYPKDGDTAEALLKNAEAALKQAKDSGKNHFRFYTEELNSKALDRLKLENALRNAIDNNELLLHYQPQIDIRSRQMVGVEALIRWRHPEMGLVSPAEFIPLAEETGLILPIGEWVVREACKQNKAWQDQGHPPVCVAVNLSARQFVQHNLVGNITDILDETGLPPQCLELEITESVAMHDVESVIVTLHQLKGLGIQLAIDDFGTGYSSLSYLKRFPIDKLKIDRAFVKHLATSSDDEAIADAIIAMAKSMNLKVVAEGVETESQLAYLEARQCDEAQGYYFCKPVEAAELQRCLEAAAQPVT